MILILNQFVNPQVAEYEVIMQHPEEETPTLEPCNNCDENSSRKTLQVQHAIQPQISFFGLTNANFLKTQKSIDITSKV